MSTQKEKYTADGTEGITLTIPALAGQIILAVYREGLTMYEVVATPDSVEFTWSTPDITLGLATGPGERFLILYKS